LFILCRDIWRRLRIPVTCSNLVVVVMESQPPNPLKLIYFSGG